MSNEFGSMLPKSGWICIAKKLNRGFHHSFFQDVQEAEAYALEEDRKGHEVYLAQATFKTADNRRQDNVQALRSFWLDIDCGEGKPYASQGDGVLALKNFCEKTGLLLPEVINSGNGLYARWVVDEDLTPQQWKPVADQLKKVCAALNLQADSTRTADSASVLRPIGTRNKKRDPKPVTKIASGNVIPFPRFFQQVHEKAKELNVLLETKLRPALNAEFLIPVQDGPPSDGAKVKSRCAQIKYIAENQDKIDEPLWYAMVGLARLCENGDQWVHIWSEKHPAYTKEETDRKVAQLEGKDIGPTTCARFEQLNPSVCLGCPLKGTIVSPIQLGKVYEGKEPTLPVAKPEEKPELPKPFEVTEYGLTWKGGEGEPVLFYDQELYVTDLAWDESVGYEVATVKHFLPHEGWKEFRFRSALTNDQKTFHMTLADNHVKIVGSEKKKVMLMYIESFLSKIQRARKMAQLVCQMGWKDDGRFVIGRNVILPDGTAQGVDLAKSVPQSVEAFHTKGELEPWVKATGLFNQSKDLLPLAFAFCAGAFGAPLMKFTGHAGAMVSMVGASGVGKTLIGTWMLSTYGCPSKLMMLKDDTKNSLIGRLGAYGNLPLYIDEVTNIDSEELSELTYRITQGRDKARLNRDATERRINNQWQTLAVVSSNSSIVDKLGALKQDASPELNRVLEFTVDASRSLTRESATDLYRTITENYGLAGIEYIKYLVAHREEHQEKIDKIVRWLDQQTCAKNEERYWSAIAGATLYGAAIARKIGLLELDTAALTQWVVELIKGTRLGKKEVINSPTDSLGQMLDDFSPNRLVVNGNDHVIAAPRGGLFMRVETDAGYIYISRQKVRDWCFKNYAAFTQTQRALTEMGVLLAVDKRKTLGAGTEYSGAPQPCWVLNLSHPELAPYQMKIIKETKGAK
jgi:hypothetical protein